MQKYLEVRSPQTTTDNSKVLIHHLIVAAGLFEAVDIRAETILKELPTDPKLEDGTEKAIRAFLDDLQKESDHMELEYGEEKGNA